MEHTNKQLEVSILGCLINNGDLYYKAADILSEDCFTTHVHQQLFGCLKEMQLEQGSVSKIQLLHKFEGVVDIAGDELKQNFLEMASSHASVVVLNFRSHVKTLVDLKQKRQIAGLLQDKLNSIQEKDALEIATEVLNPTTKIITDSPQENSIAIKSAFENIYNNVSSPEPSYKAKTGINLLDVAMGGGMQKGRVYAFLAPAKCGKTMMATTISNNLCNNGNKHLFVCAEMGTNEITERMLGQRINLPTSVFRDRKDEELKRLIAEQVTQVENNIIFENEPGIDFDRLKVVIERHVHKNKIEGFVLDYYQLVSGQQKHESQAQHLENVANWIHRVSKKHNIWCLLLVQANDEGKVLASRGLDRACDQKFMIQRPLDEQGDPVGAVMWLKMKLSRYTKLCNLGSQTQPTLQIHQNGTHIVEL